jgi:hypothetical protein
VWKWTLNRIGRRRCRRFTAAVANGQTTGILIVPTPGGARSFTKLSFPDTPKLARSVSARNP